jgi:hypothetical protein
MLVELGLAALFAMLLGGALLIGLGGGIAWLVNWSRRANRRRRL